MPANTHTPLLQPPASIPFLRKLFSSSTGVCVESYFLVNSSENCIVWAVLASENYISKTAIHCFKTYNTNINKEDREFQNREFHDRINKSNKFTCVLDRWSSMVESSVSGAWGNSNSFIEYIKMENKDGMIFPRLYSALPTSTTSSFSSPQQKDEAGHRKKKIKRKFLLAVKAVLFETSFVSFFFLYIYAHCLLKCYKHEIDWCSVSEFWVLHALLFDRLRW